MPLSSKAVVIALICVLAPVVVSPARAYDAAEQRREEARKQSQRDEAARLARIEQHQDEQNRRDAAARAAQGAENIRLANIKERQRLEALKIVPRTSTGSGSVNYQFTTTHPTYDRGIEDRKEADRKAERIADDRKREAARLANLKWQQDQDRIKAERDAQNRKDANAKWQQDQDRIKADQQRERLRLDNLADERRKERIKAERDAERRKNGG